ncbi:MAG TPA: hypothetical protein VKG80_01595 [Trebonia sp.]|nr:hypothetical protein [Trebonia sp.]
MRDAVGFAVEDHIVVWHLERRWDEFAVDDTTADADHIGRTAVGHRIRVHGALPIRHPARS